MARGARKWGQQNGKGSVAVAPQGGGTSCRLSGQLFIEHTSCTQNECPFAPSGSSGFVHFGPARQPQINKRRCSWLKKATKFNWLRIWFIFYQFICAGPQNGGQPKLSHWPRDTRGPGSRSCWHNQPDNTSRPRQQWLPVEALKAATKPIKSQMALNPIRFHARL